MNFMTEADTNRVKGLLHYLNEHFKPGEIDLAADVTLCDANGDSLGMLSYNADVDGYVHYFPARDD